MIAFNKKNQQDLLQYNKNGPSIYPMANSFLTTFTKWAKVWISTSSPTPTTNNIPCKRKKISEPTRDTDIRSRTDYYDQPRNYQRDSLLINPQQRAGLYRATCQKLRPNSPSSTTRKLIHLGDILHVRNFWDTIEKLVYQDLSNTPHYIPPSRRLPFNPDKPGSIYLPKKSKRSLAAFKHLNSPKRSTFASSTIVYNNTTSDQRINIIKVLPVVAAVPQLRHRQQLEEDDDDEVPLGALDFSNFKSSPLRRTR